MQVMVREGSLAKNLDDLMGALKSVAGTNVSFATDDILPTYLEDNGHLDYLQSRAVKAGTEPIEAVRMATMNAANWFRLRDRGGVGPGLLADICLVEDIDKFKVTHVIKNGRLVARDGRLLADCPLPSTEGVAGPLNVKDFVAERLKVRANGSAKALVIELIPNQIVTKKCVEELPVDDGCFAAETANDVAKIAVVERHKGTGNIGLGFVRGFGLKRGAMASTVAHDSHNLIIVGTNDEDMLAAGKHLIECGGGFTVAVDGKVAASVPLPIAGLISDQPAKDVSNALRELWKASAEIGSPMEDPFMALSFLALPVIPELRLTDEGLFDVNAFSHVPVAAK
jgi:adenine deaminase